MRKELSVVDFLGNGKSARFLAAKKSMVSVQGQAPRGSHAPGEAGVADVKSVPGLDECKM